MKKRILSILLSLMLALGALCAFAGCDRSDAELSSGPEIEQGGSQGNQGSQGSQNNQGGNQGSQGSQGNQGGNQGSQGNQGNQGGNQQNGGQSSSGYRVGDKITDQAMIGRLKESLQAEFKGLSGRIEFDMEEETAGAGNEEDILIEYLADLTKETAFDVRAAILEEKGGRTVKSEYGVLFGRESGVLSGTGSWQDAGVAQGDWNSLIAKCQSGALALEKVSKEEVVQNGELAQMILLGMKADPGLFAYFEEYCNGDFFKTDDGFELKIDIFGKNGLIEKIFADAEQMIRSLDFNAPLSTLFANDSLKSLFGDVSAQEVLDALTEAMGAPEGGGGIMPEALNGESAYDYLARLLQNGEFYEAATGDKGTFGELTLSDLLSQSEQKLSKEDILQALQELKTNFEETIYQSLVGNYDRILKRDCSIGLEFDEEGNFVSADFDFELEWTVGGATYDVNLDFELRYLAAAPVLTDLSKGNAA